MNYRTIAIDCDDVLVDTAASVINHYNKTYNTDLTIGETYSNDPARWGVNDRQTATDRVDAFMQSEEYLNVPPFKEAIAAIKQLSKHYSLHVVTGRPELLEGYTHEFLGTYFPGLFQSVTFTGLFTAKPRSKADVCKEIDADLLIDDHIAHATVVAKAGIDVLLFGDYPWSKVEQLPDNVQRVKGWGEITTLLLPKR